MPIRQRTGAILALAGTYESAHSFASYANWIVPGRIMLGRYPYVEPSRCQHREQGEEQLSAILGAGITTFVSLQVGSECGARGRVEPPTLGGASGWHLRVAGGGGDAQPRDSQDEVPAQADMRVAGANGFLPYKATAEMIHATLVG